MNRLISPSISLARSSFWVVLLSAFLSVALCGLFPFIGFAGDSLSQLRSDVRNSTKPKEKPKKELHWEYDEGHHDHDHYDDHEDSWEEDWENLKAGVFLAVLTAPFLGPMQAMDDSYDNTGYFPRFPYEDDLLGHMWVDGWEPEEARIWRARARAEYGDDFGDLSYLSGQILLETNSRFGIDSEFFYRSEDLSGGMTDNLWTGDFNFVFRFAQSERAEMRAGLGLNWLVDEIDDSYGFNFTYGGDFFPAEPWVLSADLDWGKLGGADLFHGRATVGLQFHGVEVYTGYDYFDVGGAQIDGLIGGLRFWF